MHHKW